MKHLIVILIAVFSCQVSFAQIIADTTYNPLIKRKSALYHNLIGQHIDSLYDGSISNDLSALHGHKIHINLWSTTCRPCIQEFPELNQLKQLYKGENIQFVAIAKEPKSATERILQAHPLDYELIFDGLDFFEALGVKQYPVNLFINEAGVIDEITTGVFMKGEIVEGKTVMNMHNLPYYKMILSAWTKR